MSDNENTLPVFVFCGASEVTADHPLLGLWQATFLPVSGEAVSFAPDSDEGRALLPVWRANFPQEKKSIARELQVAQRHLRASETAVHVTPQRLDAFARRGSFGSTVSYSLWEAQPEPENDLAELLFEAGGNRLSYGAMDSIGMRRQEAVATLNAFTRQFQQICAHFALVETWIGEKLVGQSRVEWSGHIHTALPASISSTQRQLHSQTLDLALRSRHAIWRIATLVITGAAKLVAQLSVPGGFLRAAPLVLRFVEQLRLEYESLSSKSSTFEKS